MMTQKKWSMIRFLVTLLVLLSLPTFATVASARNGDALTIFTAPRPIGTPPSLPQIRKCGDDVCVPLRTFEFYERRNTHYYMFPRQCQTRLDAARELWRGEQFRRVDAVDQYHIADNKKWGYMLSGLAAGSIASLFIIYSR